MRFTQAVGVFDNVTVEGGAPGAWDSDAVGEMNQTDWEKFHQASGAEESGGVITVSGTGDIGPIGEDSVGVEMRLLGLILALIIVIVASARFGALTARETVDRRTIAARAFVLGAASFVTGLVAVGLVLPVGGAILTGKGFPLPPVPLLTDVRVVVGLAAAIALCAVFTYSLGVWLRRGWAANLAGLSLIVLPYAVTSIPLLPDAVADWLLRLTPAAGFAVQQTAVEYAQVVAHYAPSAGFFPLPWWAGLAVLCAYTAVALRVALAARRGAGAAATFVQDLRSTARAPSRHE